MTHRRARSLVTIILVLSLLCTSALAETDEGEATTAASWRPWLSIGFDLRAQDVEAGFASDSVPLLEGGVRSSRAMESELILVPNISFESALESPPIFDAWGKPRLFAHAGGKLPTKIAHKIFRDEGPEGDSSLGRSANHDYRFKFDGSWFAGLGVAWSVPLGERQLSIRPAFDYFGEHVRWEGMSLLLEREAGAPTSALPTPVFAASRSLSKTYHAIGPSLALEVLLGQRGPVSLKLYAQSQFYWILTDPEASFAVANEIGSGNGVIRFETDSMIAEGGVGVRLTWLPR